jgi:hypothetical protein
LNFLQGKAIGFVASQAQPCLDSISGLPKSCTDTSILDTPKSGPCSKVLVGTLADGASCESWQDCAPTEYGNTPCPGEFGANGVCAPLRVDPQGRCGYGVPQADGGTIYEAACPADKKCDDLHNCITPPVEGEACGWDAMKMKPFCQTGFYCADMTKICHKQPAEGEACTTDEQCGEQLSCISSRCSKRPAAGFPCYEGTSCDDGAYCEAGVCMRLPKAGQECNLETCAPGNTCVGLVCQDTWCLWAKP